MSLILQLQNYNLGTHRVNLWIYSPLFFLPSLLTTITPRKPPGSDNPVPSAFRAYLTACCPMVFQFSRSRIFNYLLSDMSTVSLNKSYQALRGAQIKFLACGPKTNDDCEGPSFTPVLKLTSVLSHWKYQCIAHCVVTMQHILDLLKDEESVTICPLQWCPIKVRDFHQNESCPSCTHPPSSYEERREQRR